MPESAWILSSKVALRESRVTVEGRLWTLSHGLYVCDSNKDMELAYIAKLLYFKLP